MKDERGEPKQEQDAKHAEVRIDLLFLLLYGIPLDKFARAEPKEAGE